MRGPRAPGAPWDIYLLKLRLGGLIISNDIGL
jgi:hypothetical protein